jgi:addiction module HigA family antidote
MTVPAPARRDVSRAPTHPGAILREDTFRLRKKSKTEIADLLGITRQHLHSILQEKSAISPQVAVKIGKLFGSGPGIWMRMQAAYDTWNVILGMLSRLPTSAKFRPWELPKQGRTQNQMATPGLSPRNS